MTGRRRIELWVEQREGRPAVNPVMGSLLDALRADGHDARVRVPEARAATPPPPPRGTLVLLRTGTTLALSVAVAHERWGHAFLNTAEASRRAGDKAETVARLAAAGLPVPVTHLRTGTPTVGPVPGRGWVVKPVHGWHGDGVVLHRADGRPEVSVPQDPEGRVVDDGCRLAQVRVGTGTDLKAYVVGGRVLLARKRFGPGSHASDERRAVTPDRRLLDIVHGCGDATDLTVYGVDLRRDREGVVVVDVNAFPGFRGFPVAARLLADAVSSRLAAGPP